jgi:hypothetical protein
MKHLVEYRGAMMLHSRAEDDSTTEMFLERAWLETQCIAHGRSIAQVNRDIATKFLGCKYEEKNLTDHIIPTPGNNHSNG